MLLCETDWPQITEIREAIERHTPTSVEHAAGNFVTTFVNAFPSLVLARMFLVVPFRELPAGRQKFARTKAADESRLTEKTPVLSLLATHGREEPWNHVAQSQGHLAIPLVDKASVLDAPMIAKLLAELQLDLAPLDDGFAVHTSRMLGAHNGKFFVPNADTAFDDRGRHVIPARDFVKRYDVRTVFGMGGSYFDGTLVVAIFFTTERLDKLTTDRFGSFISTFKTVTTKLHQTKLIFDT